MGLCGLCTFARAGCSVFAMEDELNELRKRDTLCPSSSLIGVFLNAPFLPLLPTSPLRFYAKHERDDVFQLHHPWRGVCGAKTDPVTKGQPVSVPSPCEDNASSDAHEKAGEGHHGPRQSDDYVKDT